MEYFKCRQANMGSCTPTGNGYEPEYEFRMQKNGEMELEKVGEKDQNAYIQSFKEGHTVEAIVAKALSGDVTVLSRVKGQYIDLTKMPQNLRDAQQQQLAAESMFASLPTEYREKFNNSVKQFMNEAAVDPKGWEAKMSVPAAKAEETVIKKEVVSE